MNSNTNGFNYYSEYQGHGGAHILIIIILFLGILLVGSYINNDKNNVDTSNTNNYNEDNYDDYDNFNYDSNDDSNYDSFDTQYDSGINTDSSINDSNNEETGSRGGAFEYYQG